MKEMTTAEFQKAKLDALEEPVKVRRYTKAVGTYYPEGFEPSTAPKTAPASIQSSVMDEEIVAAQKVIAQLEDDNRHLKKLLAAKMESFEALQSRTNTVAVPVGSELLSQERRTIPQHPMKDVFADLAKQDREFFERKLGKPAKTK